MVFIRRFSSSIPRFFEPRKNANITHSTTSYEHLLSEGFLKLLRSVSGEFQPEYRKLLTQRTAVQKQINANQWALDYRKDTAWIREDRSWRAPEIVPELIKRHVEITGPAGNAKMMIHALNSGANGYMADLEDSQSPTWAGIMRGHDNLVKAVQGHLTVGKNLADGNHQRYTINTNPATLHVRPRGLHMLEKHVIDESGRPMPAGLFDISMYMYHNAETLLQKGQRPLFYIPKLESFEEACFIHDVIQQLEAHLGLPYGTVRVTALIETLPGLLQAEEIGFALGDYWAGLNGGRWDYIFSVMKSQASNPNHAFPDRHLLTMDTPFLTHYMQRIVQVCHRRGVHAMGGMSAFIPSKDAQENKRVMDKVVADKRYEIEQGCDGAWVAHPAMVKPIQHVFNQELEGRANQLGDATHLNAVVLAENFVESPYAKTQVEFFTEAGLRTNISVGIQYLASWFHGDGAVAIRGLMEDMATAEISRTQAWQWLHHKQTMTFDGGIVKALDKDTFHTIYQTELLELKATIEQAMSPAEEKNTRLADLEKAAEMFYAWVTADTLQPFIQDSACDALNHAVEKPKSLKKHFIAHQPLPKEISRLQGARPDLTLDARLAIVRGLGFNEKMAEIRADGLVAHGSFIGTPTGHGARNVIEGGLGYSWPYIGGWELNARGLAMGQPMPDTLSVSFHEQGDLAQVINRFLDAADKVQTLEREEKLEKIALLPVEKQEEAKIQLVAQQIDYYTQPLLADLEQGWGDPKKAFFAVVRCLQNGVNIMHIEDQYSLKRCGHLGGKGLDDINGWIITMKAANLAASIFEGVHRDGPQQNVNFVARTDALSAEFIQFSNHMHDPNHPDHPFIDWDKGFTPDGRYLYLKKGINPETGRKYGLEHSARRCSEIVKAGLASHVWMETPDANVGDAKAFMDLVNEHLAPQGLFARGLYNHSPSFVWDVRFFIEAQTLAKALGEYIQQNIQKPLDEKNMSLEKAHWLVKKFLKDQGDRVRGDYHFSDDSIAQILGNGLDLARGKDHWREAMDEQVRLLNELGPSLQTYKAQKELDRILDLGYRPARHVTNTIVAQRLKNFKNGISNAGYEVHLCTLPLYPTDAYMASRLARGMTETGIHDFVIMQREARKYEAKTHALTSFFHQRSTGTGYEVSINSIVGTANTDILHGSTEHADHHEEQKLRDKGTGPSTYRA
jgi:malate synthase